MEPRIEAIRSLYLRRGGEQYTGESVTHLEHALQSAFLAEQEISGDNLVTAALLHDLGHLLHELGDTPSANGVDDEHQNRVVPYLKGLLDDSVIAAIQKHVSAKRYLCFSKPSYYDALSEDSKRSLALQGGVFNEVQANAFMQEPSAADAIKVRVWDDLAKTPGLPTPNLDHYLEIANRVALLYKQQQQKTWNVQFLKMLEGTWVGDGKGIYPPRIPEFSYKETLVISPTAKPIVWEVKSVTKHAESGKPMHSEVGFFRCPPDGSIELTLTHPFGLSELSLGTPDYSDSSRLVLNAGTGSLFRSPSAKTPATLGLRRTYNLSADRRTLIFDMDMATDSSPDLKHHLLCNLTKQ